MRFFFVCFLYFFREGSRVCTRNSHSGVLVTGLASTPPRSSTRAPPGAQGLLCPIVFIPAQSCLLAFEFSCPGNILCWPHLESDSGPLPHWVSAGRRFSTLLAPHSWYQTRREVPITWPFFFFLNIYLFLRTAVSALRGSWGRSCLEPPSLFLLSRKRQQAFALTVLWDLAAAGSTCSRQVPSSLATPRHRPPAQLSWGIPAEDVPTPVPISSRSHWPRHAALDATLALGGV